MCIRDRFSTSYPEPLDKFQPNLAQSILGWRGFKFVQMKDPTLFQGEIITKKQKYIDKIKKILFSRTIEPITIKLGTKHPWVKWIQVCSKEGPHPFPRGDNYEIVKIHYRNLKILVSKTTGSISTKIGTKHPWVKGIQDSSNKGPAFFQGEIITKKQKYLSLIHIWRCRRYAVCRSRWSPYH